jgi:NitT/TauT family transport system substrate-binding protein
VDTVSQVRVEGAAKAQAVVAKRVDGQVGFGILEAPQIAALGAEPVVLNFADWGVPVMGLGLVTNDTLLAQQPDLVRRFVRASAKSWQYALDHQEEAIQALVRRFPGVKSEVAMQQLKLTLPLLATAATKGKPLGWMAESDWEAMQQLLVRSKQIEKARPAPSYFTNDFLPR